MSRYVLIFLLTLGLTSIAICQDQEQSDTLIVEKEPGKFKEFIDRQAEVGAFISVNYGFHPQPEGYGINGLIALGVHLNNWTMSLFYAGYGGEYDRLLVFPTYSTMAYEHAGIAIGNKLIVRKAFNLYSKVRFSYGFIEWVQQSSNNEVFFRDRLLFFQPELEAESKLTKRFRVLLTVGYKLVGDFTLPQLPKEDLTGPYVSMGLKFGVIKEK